MKYLKVYPDKTLPKKDGWNWACAEPSRKQKGKENILYSASGYNSFGIALRRAKAHNKLLKKELPIKIFNSRGRKVITG